jgi:flagellar biosynthesis component FlhA
VLSIFGNYTRNTLTQSVGMMRKLIVIAGGVLLPLCFNKQSNSLSILGQEEEQKEEEEEREEEEAEEEEEEEEEEEKEQEEAEDEEE